MMYKNYGWYDTPIDYTKPKTKKQKEKIKRYEHRLKVIDKKVGVVDKEIEKFKKQNQKIFDVLDKLEHKQYELCEKHCKLDDRWNDYEEKFVVRKGWLDDCAWQKNVIMFKYFKQKRRKYESYNVCNVSMVNAWNLN